MEYGNDKFYRKQRELFEDPSVINKIKILLDDEAIEEVSILKVIDLLKNYRGYEYESSSHNSIRREFKKLCTSTKTRKSIFTREQIYDIDLAVTSNCWTFSWKCLQSGDDWALCLHKDEQYTSRSKVIKYRRVCPTCKHRYLTFGLTKEDSARNYRYFPY